MEETLKTEFKDIANALYMEEEKLFALQEIKRKLAQEIEERWHINTTSINEVILYNSYLHELSGEIELQEKRVAHVQQLYEKKREALIQASMDRKIVEKLKEKDLLSMQNKEKREEKKMLDEIGRNLYLINDNEE